MNSSDRSIGHIDVAIRRRFGLFPLGAKPQLRSRNGHAPEMSLTGYSWALS